MREKRMYETFGDNKSELEMKISTHLLINELILPRTGQWGNI